MAEDREKEIAFMNNPHKWPRWPWLPMKRAEEFALLHADSKTGKPTPLYKVNVFQIRTWFPTNTMPRTKEYQTFDEILNDGWKID